ncbi:hypothetical protein ACFDTO_04505 [Microbacteriaceae bacterium 4G12]
MVTGDDIAVALLEYAEALALARLSATVEIPVRLANGTLDRAVVLIGPASEMTAVHHPDEGDEIVDAALVAHLTQETVILKTPPRPVIDDTPFTLDVPADL